MRRPDEHRRGGFSSGENLELVKAGARFLTYSWKGRGLKEHSVPQQRGQHRRPLESDPGMAGA